MDNLLFLISVSIVMLGIIIIACVFLVRGFKRKGTFKVKVHIEIENTSLEDKSDCKK